MTLRERAGLAVVVGACVLAFVDAALRPLSPLIAGVRASLFGCGLLLVPLSLALVAGAARRDETVSAGDVVESRPFPAHLLFLARFAGTYAAVLAAYGMVIVAALLAPLLLAGKFASPLTFVDALLRGVVPLLFIAALGYCGVALARNALAAAVVAVYWLFILLWGDFLARIFNFTLTQNWPTYAALALAIVLETAAVRQRQELAGSQRKSGDGLVLAAVGLLLFGLLNAWQRVAVSHDKPLRQDPFALELASQYLDSSPRAPGMWLPDQRGRLFRSSSLGGKALAIAFWSPHVPASLIALDAMRDAAKKVSGDEVAFVAICLADDHALSAHVAREGGYPFVMVTDTGTHFAKTLETCAPLSEAFKLHDLPAVFVTDRGARIVAELGGQGLLHAAGIASAIESARAIPVPPGIGVERT